ncbi:hypothetical protein TPB0596_17860 [Tsukamurella pulmonis]|nr:hypothetical protein TPB0596_17860 [Tsukamurella pulmonis]
MHGPGVGDVPVEPAHRVEDRADPEPDAGEDHGERRERDEHEGSDDDGQYAHDASWVRGDPSLAAVVRPHIGAIPDPSQDAERILIAKTMVSPAWIRPSGVPVG